MSAPPTDGPPRDAGIPGYRGPINPNPTDEEASISIYLYQPWLGGAIAGVVTFGIAMVIQLVFTVRHRGLRWIHGLLALGCLMEVGGYAARIRGSANMFLVNTFIAQYFLIVVAPIPIAAAIYLILSYAAQRFPGGHKLVGIKGRWLVACFVFMDIVTIAVQVAGAALVGVVQSKQSQGEKPPVTITTANNILLAGLAVQTFFFSVFICLLVLAITRIKRLPAMYRPNARKLLLINLAAALLVLLRTVYRLAVECQGYFGAANSSQTLYTCLEYLPVILALAIFCVFPLARFMPDRHEAAQLTHSRFGSEEVKDQY